MAETDAAAKGLDFLKHKVGPLPIGVWLLIGAGGLWYFERQKSSSSAAASGQQTDPAGNTGTIDPATGYVYGSPEDQAALAAGDSGSTGTGPSGSSTPGAQSYADNNTWGIAAVNYLTGLGIDATTANQAVQLYLNSQPLTTAQQGDVNLAITALGPPPTLPGPVSANPNPVTTPPGTSPKGSGTSRNPTPVISAGRVVSTTPNGAVVAWNATGATSFRTTIAGPGRINGQTGTVTAKQATYSGLQSGHTYEVTVQPLLNGKAAGSPGKITVKTPGGSAATTGKKP